MRRVWAVALTLAVAAALVVAALYATAPAATRVKVGDRAPALSLPRLAGGPPEPTPGLGRSTVVLAIFDPRTSPTAFRLGDLERLHRRYGPRGLRVVGVSLHADAAALRAAAEAVGVTFPLFRDPGGVALHDTYGVPSGFLAYVIAPTGVVEGVYRNTFDWRADDVRERLEAHLQPAPPGW
jgi:peroxiredoxin